MTLIYLCSTVLALSWLWGLVLLLAFFDLYKRPEHFFGDWLPTHVIEARVDFHATQPLPPVKLKHPSGQLFRAWSATQRTDKRPGVWRNVL